MQVAGLQREVAKQTAEVKTLREENEVSRSKRRSERLWTINLVRIGW